MIGTKLKIARKNNNMTLKDVEKITGISNGNLSNYENNRNIPGGTAIITLCKLYNISADWLLLDKDPLHTTDQDLIFLKRYNKLTEREKGRIDQLMEDIEKTKPYEKAGNL